MGWAGQGGGLVQDPQLLSCPLLLATWSCQACLTSWRGPRSIPSQVPAQLILGDTVFLLMSSYMPLTSCYHLFTA